MSPLGKALTGAAAKLFKELDSKTRGKLDDLVSTGVLKAENVVKGLRGIAEDAVEERYGKELPLNAEETRILPPALFPARVGRYSGKPACRNVTHDPRCLCYTKCAHPQL
ncbi:hypothetical protein D3877_02660 [Azospirillum cavernae]|uniref:Uncharacterized protein n=1 Tax=Azospirillum cavernae TaxID=2320860 RepID=A0A418W0P9_9PROT|nr:hypothetical protein [Azospirillum cavernae]RJF83571.1 hypothetical protein D3877_02660 [Azospirillum cavernae]